MICNEWGNHMAKCFIMDVNCLMSITTERQYMYIKGKCLLMGAQEQNSEMNNVFR